MSSTMFGLAGKVAVVTGAASGIGKAAAERLAAAQAEVVVLDVDEEAGRAVADAIDGRFARADVSSYEDVAEAMKQAAGERGRLDIVVNNAGIALPSQPLTETTREHFDEHLGVNARGVLNGMRAAAPYMRGGGAIVNTASILGVLALPGYASYAASKFAVVGLTKVGAIELGPLGVRVNCICPTSVDTPMLWTFPAGRQEASALSDASTLGRIAQPEHVAALIHFLAADDCPVISGQAVLIDCGVTAGLSAAVWDSHADAGAR
jgi:NAD(P)-dependent dehydrogenase (short-subunit alcohol dehydrogenase family)